MTTPFGILPDDRDYLDTLSGEERREHLQSLPDTRGVEVSHQPVMDPDVLSRGRKLNEEARKRIHEVNAI